MPQASVFSPNSQVCCGQIRELLTTLDSPADLTKISESTPFSEAGLDSLDFYNLVIAVESRFGMSIPASDLNRVNSIEKMVEYIHQGEQ